LWRVIARRPKADVAISYPSKDRGCSGAKPPHDDAHSFDLDGAVVPFERNLKAMETQTPTSRILLTCLGSVVLALVLDENT
jgi:hypothetical protein